MAGVEAAREGSGMTVHDDLATLRSPTTRQYVRDEAADRVEAEVVRLAEYAEGERRARKATEAVNAEEVVRARTNLEARVESERARAEAAEAEVARLEQERHEDLVAHLNRASLLSDEVTRLRDGLRDLAELERPADLMRQIARALLADQDGAA